MADIESDEELDQFEEDFYAFLCLPKNAAPENITNAYRRLSRIYHPDKHTDPLRKTEAEVLFNKTKKAYQVLIDPHKRAIYDNLGTKGLETEGWEVVQRTKTPQEIREEYERLAREREERRLHQRTNPKGTMTVSINATDLFNPYGTSWEDYKETGSMPIVEVKSMTFSQAIEAPLTLKDTVLMSGHLSTHNGTGAGSVNVALRRVISEKGWVECEVGAGSGLNLTAKGFRTLSKRTFLNISGVLTNTPRGIRPGFVMSLGNQLDRHMVGYLTYKGGVGQSAMSTSIIRDNLTSNLQFSMQFGVPHSYISLSYVHKFPENEGKLRGAIKAGTFGAQIEYGVDRKVSQYSTVGAAVSVGVPTGVMVKLKLVRGNQTYVFPVHLCEEVLPGPIFYGTLVPVVAWVAIRTLIIQPYMQDQNRKKIDRQREQYKSKIAEKKREAQAAIDLMQETYRRNVSEEEGKKGLLITVGLYGRFVSGDDNTRARQEGIADVTIPLQCLVKDSKLIVHENTKSQLPGFYDPCIGEEKSLLVQYTFHGLPHEVIVQDNEPLRIPKQTHRKT
nr:EOG090X03AJ [Lepidurus arcticus]